MNKPTKKSVLYLRVSTEEQVENFSLGTQEEICTREAQFRGYTVEKVFREEGRSAKTIKGRIVLLELLSYCRKYRKEIDAVFVYKTDRLSRQIFDYLKIQQDLSNLGIQLISATEPTDDTAMGKFLGNFFAQIAQFDNDIRSERARNGMRARFNSGLFHNGHPPVGYISIDGAVIKDPKTFDKIKEAWNLMGTGTKSLREMKVALENCGIPLAFTSVNRMFRSKFYTGILYSPTYKEEVQGQHIPMITKELFNKVQIILDGRNPNKPALARRDRLNPDFPLRRFINCGACGQRFTGAWSTGRGGKFAYYYCHKYNICRSKYIPIKIAHDELSGLMKRIFLTSQGKTIFLLILENIFKERASVLGQKGIRRNQQLKKLLDLQKTLIQKHLTGIYSDEIFEEQNESLEKNIQSIKTMTNENLIKQYSFQEAIKYIEKLISKFEIIYESSEISQKKILLSLIFPEGFIWSYPGLTYSTINPIFKEEYAKISSDE